MNIFVNTQPIKIEPKETLSSVLQHAGIESTRGIAVALNNTVIPKAKWETVSFSENDKITVIKATQGG